MDENFGDPRKGGDQDDEDERFMNQMKTLERGNLQRGRT
jgi:hypothetical protein